MFIFKNSILLKKIEFLNIGYFLLNTNISVVTMQSFCRTNMGRYTRLYLQIARSNYSKSKPVPKTFLDDEENDYYTEQSIKHSRCGAPVSSIQEVQDVPEEGETFDTYDDESGPWNGQFMDRFEEGDYWVAMLREYRRDKEN